MTTTRMKAALAVACVVVLLAWTQATVAWVTARFGTFDDDLLGGTISMIPFAALLATVVLIALPALADGGRRVALGVATALGMVMVGATADNIAGALRDGSISPEGWLVAGLSAALVVIVGALAVVVAREPMAAGRR